MYYGTKMESLLGSDTTHPNVNLLTAIFFGLFFLCATQDIAVSWMDTRDCSRCACCSKWGA